MTNLQTILLTSAILVLCLVTPLYVASKDNGGFWWGLIILIVQVVILTTAYYNFSDSQGEKILIAYEKGRNTADRLD